MNCSDIGTKALAKKRLLMLLKQVGAVDPSIVEPVGEGEYHKASERLVGQQSMRRLVKSVMRMAVMMGLQDLTQCWNQVAEEDEYAGQLDVRINSFQERVTRFDQQIDMAKEELQDEIQTVSDNESMLREYVNGLHYAVVESGGWVRYALGVNGGQWVHMTTLERANMITEERMGTQRYMTALRQRSVHQGPADETDNGAMEESETDVDAEDMEVGPGTTAGVPQTVTDMIEFL
eukprot:s4023_g2.t1